MSSGSRFVRLFVSQLGFKVISFCATSLLTRALTPSARGIGFFFEMYFLSAGFLAREAIRSLHARVPLRSPLSQQAVRGSGIVCALFALFVLVPLCALHAALSADSSLLQAVRFYSLPPVFSYLPVALLLTAALMLDLLAESHFNLIIGSGSQGGIESRARTESISLLCKTGVGAAVVYGSKFLFGSSEEIHNLLGLAAVAFAAGHFAYGATTWVVSGIELAKWVASNETSEERNDASLTWILPGRLCFVTPTRENLAAAISFYAQDRSVNRDADNEQQQQQRLPPLELEFDSDDTDSGNRALMSQFLQENVLRLFLTEGEKFVLSSSATVALSAQGAFDVATSIGALAARLLFRLWEEFAFNEWARGASSILALESYFAPSPTKMPRDDGVIREKKKQALAVLKESVSLFHNMCRVAVVVGVLCCAFGPLLSGRVLWLLFGSRWANKEASDILSVFVCVLPLFGLNGLVEAFGRAMCTAVQLQQARTKLLVVSGLYLASALGALVLSGGDVRLLVLANAGQFMLRIGIGLHAAKEVIDQKRESLGPHEQQQHKFAPSSWVDFLLPIVPNPIVISVSGVVAGFGWAKMPPSFEAETGSYTSPLLQRDVVLIGCAVGVLLLAVVTEPDARKLAGGFLSRRKRD